MTPQSLTADAYIPRRFLVVKKSNRESGNVVNSTLRALVAGVPLSSAKYTFSRKSSTPRGMNFSSGANQIKGAHWMTNFSTATQMSKVKLVNLMAITNSNFQVGNTVKFI